MVNQQAIDALREALQRQNPFAVVQVVEHYKLEDIHELAEALVYAWDDTQNAADNTKQILLFD